MRAGAVDVIEKPFTDHALRARVDRVMASVS
jgi:FixJ family two-component response regulator